MLDSGATSNFVSQRFVETYNVPLKKKARPIPLSVIDGTPISTKAITHQTVACDLTLGPANEHRETLTLDAIPMATYDVILGMPWLNTHTPWIHWSKRKLVFASGYSLSASATVATAVDGTWIAATREEEPAEELPEAYKNYEHLFAEEGANELPPHRPWDLSIELMEGKTPPYRPIYAMSQPESESLRKMIEENTERGFIRESKSPAGAPVTFAKKKDGELRVCMDY